MTRSAIMLRFQSGAVGAILVMAHPDRCGDGRQAPAMRTLFRLDGAAKRHPAVELWWDEHQGPLGAMARRWFEAIRHCGDDVREVLHDDQPTACVGRAAFAYVDAFTSHVNVGFFQGAELPDPQGLLEGAGKFMRH